MDLEEVFEIFNMKNNLKHGKKFNGGHILSQFHYNSLQPHHNCTKTHSTLFTMGGHHW